MNHSAPDSGAATPKPETVVTVTRAPDAADDRTAQPALNSGFGGVMEQEHDLQSSTDDYLGAVNGRHSRAIDHILRDQQTRLTANIALLEQRYETLCRAARPDLQPGPLGQATTHPAIAVAASIRLLPNLVAQHLGLLRSIDTLIAERADGQRGELILKQVARAHEEMASTLTALLKEDAFEHPDLPPPVLAAVAQGLRFSATEGN